MVSWSLDACRACGVVRAIVVAVPAGHQHGLDGVVTVDGGSTRAESVANALATDFARVAPPSTVTTSSRSCA